MMITSGSLLVYNEALDFDVRVHYDAFELDSKRVSIFLFDNNCNLILTHDMSTVSFMKEPDFWISRLYETMLA